MRPRQRPGQPVLQRLRAALGPPETGAPPTRFDSPGGYTPPHLAQRILASRKALEGERKQVTVLFADTKGSMELLADRDPEDARRLLDAVLERMIDAVHRYEGTVNQVLGDGIMALFGAPIAHENHAVRACYAALRMQEDVGRYGDEMQRTLGVPVQIRVGLNSGEVVVGSIGSDLRMEYSAVGQTTHLAARMEQMAKPASVLLSGETLRLAEGYVQVRALGPVPVRGMADPVEVFELVGPPRRGPASRCRRCEGSPGWSGDRPSWASCARRSTTPGTAGARSWRSWARRGSGSRAWPGRSRAPIGVATGSSSRAAPRHTAKRRPGCP